MNLRSKLPHVGTTIFSIMSALANKHKAINLSQGFPNFDPDPRLIELVTHYMQSGKNQYAPMTGVAELRNAIAVKTNKTYPSNIDPVRNINITAGGTQAIFTAINSFVKSGDEVIIIEPAFDCYEPVISLVGAQAVPYELKYPDFRVDWSSFKGLITPKTSMIIINTPHNPSGQLLVEDDFMTLSNLVKGKDIIVLSDEVYEHLVYDDKKHYSILDFPDLFKQGIAVFSFGKTFHCTGWKVGYAIMPYELMKEFRKVHQFNVFSVNSFVQYALADFMKNSKVYADLPSFYQQKRDILTHYIEKSNLELVPSKGTYFLMARFSDTDMSDVQYSTWLTKEKKLASIPVSVFYSSNRDDRLIRFCFAKTEEILHQAGQIIIDL